MEKKSTVQRLKEYLDYKGISIRKFEESVGFSNGSFGSQYKNNKTIGADKVENILNVYPEISAEWLLRGRGEMCLGDEAVSHLASKIQSLEAEYNQLLGENRALREMLGMKEKESSSKSA